MNPYATDLNIPFPPFVGDAHPNDLYQTIKLKYVLKPYLDISPKDLNPELVDWFDDRGLELYISELFSKLPNPARSANRIHSGAGDATDATKVNWVWGGEGSCMTWYQKKKPGVPSPVPNAVKSNIVYYTDLEEENAEPMHRHVLAYPTATLIQIACPHAVENPKEKRWALTTVYRDKHTKKVPTYAEMYERLKDVVVK